jgi:outer membrane protein assembly complex protein YaeT
MILVIFLLMNSAEFLVRSIKVTGNEYFAESAIKRILLTKTKNLFRRGVFNEGVFDGDVEAVKNLYVYEGFLDVNVEPAVHHDSAELRVDISIEITEGAQYFVDATEFGGNEIFTGESLTQELTIRAGDIFDPRKVSNDNYIIRYLYDDLGYADVVVESEYHARGEKVIVTHTIVEGAKQYVGEIEIQGLKHTDTSVVRRYINMAHGDVFRYARILESQRKLYRLEIFTVIRTQVENSDIPNHKDIRFSLTEREWMALKLRAGYGTRDRVRVGVGFTHYNVFGRAYQGKVDGKVSFIEQRISTGMNFPRTFRLPGRLGVGLFFKRLEETGYTTQSLGGNAVTRIALDANELSAKYEVERIGTYYGEDDSTEYDLLHGIIVGWLRDKRNDPFYTARGYYTNVNFEVSGIIFPSDVDYIRPTAQVRFYHPLGSFVFGVALKAGMVRPFSPTFEVPVYKRFYCGGSSSVRGYAERAIGPVDENDNPLGGRYLAEFSAELRFPLYRILGGVVFIDGGNIWQEYGEIPQGLRWGSGVGLRLRSPLGSIRLDYGFKLAREEDEPVGAFHFAIGEAF